jgi:hypothetical protein
MIPPAPGYSVLKVGRVATRPGDPSTLDWGFSEVSLVAVGESDRSRAHGTHPLPHRHAVVRKEGHTWMEIVFVELEITESPSATG